MECSKGLTDEQIVTEMSKPDMGKCNGCPNLKYEDGMLICKERKEG